MMHIPETNVSSNIFELFKELQLATSCPVFQKSSLLRVQPSYDAGYMEQANPIKSQHTLANGNCPLKHCSLEQWEGTLSDITFQPSFQACQVGHHVSVHKAPPSILAYTEHYRPKLIIDRNVHDFGTGLKNSDVKLQVQTVIPWRKVGNFWVILRFVSCALFACFNSVCTTK